MRKIIEIVFVLCILVLLFVWVMPWKNREIDLREAVHRQETADILLQAHNERERTVPPDRIAVLFGWKKRKPVAISADTPEVEEKVEEKITRASWLKPLGYVIGQDSKKYYFFKDEKSNIVLQLSDDNSDNGWRLLEAKEEEFLLEYEGEKYSVPYR
jgi:hypothetical protein